MSPSPRHWACALIPAFLFLMLGSFAFGRAFETRALNGVYRQGPRAVLTIHYDEPVNGFGVGDFYALKVLRVGGESIDWGFVRLNVEE